MGLGPDGAAGSDNVLVDTHILDFRRVKSQSLYPPALGAGPGAQPNPTPHGAKKRSSDKAARVQTPANAPRGIHSTGARKQRRRAVSAANKKGQVTSSEPEAVVDVSYDHSGFGGHDALLEAMDGHDTDLGSAKASEFGALPLPQGFGLLSAGMFPTLGFSTTAATSSTKARRKTTKMEDRGRPAVNTANHDKILAKPRAMTTTTTTIRDASQSPVFTIDLTGDSPSPPAADIIAATFIESSPSPPEGESQCLHMACHVGSCYSYHSPYGQCTDFCACLVFGVPPHTHTPCNE